MLVVNNPGDEAHTFAQAAHSAWNGCTIADLVFPAFLVVLGVTTQLSLSAHTARAAHGFPWRAVLRRAGWLMLAGLLLNAYPFFEKHASAGPSWLPASLAHVMARLAQLRVTGVLQRISVVYVATAVLAHALSPRRFLAALVALLVGYWLLLAWVPAPGYSVAGLLLRETMTTPAATLPVWLDWQLLDWERWGLGWHLWDRARDYDPEGVLSTVAAVATGMLGVVAGRELTAQRPLITRVQRVAVMGALLVVTGLLWSLALPLNKPLWTSSYALFTAGVAMLGLAGASWLADVRASDVRASDVRASDVRASDVRAWLVEPWLVFGTNPFLMYIGSELLASILRSSIKWRVDGRLISTGGAVTRLFTTQGVPAPWASLAWSLLFTVGCWLLVRPLYRRRIFVTL
jgi:predicted acyltransferase